MLEEVRGLLVELIDECAGLVLDKGHKALHVLAGTDELGEETAVLAELVAVWEESQSPVPADELAADGNHRPRRVDGGLLLEHVDCVLRRVEDDVWVAEHRYRDDITCRGRG